MLDGLDDVPWADLTHAYGTASDVPGALRAVADGDREALWELYGNIWHQGTVYEATAPAVSFLVELLEEEKADTAELLGLLQCLANGSSYLDVHRRLGPRSRRHGEEVDRRVAQELAWVRAAHDAVVEGVPSYLRHLASGTEATRSAAAWLLGSCTEAADRIRPALVERLERDGSGVVRASLILALEALGAGDHPRVVESLEDRDTTPRVAAALVTARREGALDVGAILESSVPEAWESLERLEWIARDDGDILVSLINRLRGRRDLQFSLLTSWMGHDDVDLREAAVFATETVMHEYRPAAARLVPELARRLSDPEVKVRRWAASTISSAGRASRLASDALWDLLQREPLEQTSPGAHALSGLCRQRDPRAASFLRDVWEGCLRSRSRIPEPTICALKWIGAWAEPCRAVLIRLLPIVDRGNARIGVIGAIGELGVSAVESLPAILAEIDSHPHVVTRVLGDWGPAAAAALPDVERQLDHDDAHVRVNAARAVWRIAGRGDTAMSIVRAQLDQHRRGRVPALPNGLELLAEMGPAARSLAGSLPPLLDSDDDWISLRSAVAHWRLVGDPGVVLPVLVDCVQCEPRGLLAVRCLMEIGAPAASVLPQLHAAVDATDRQVVIGSTDVWIEMDEEWETLCREAITRIER